MKKKFGCATCGYLSPKWIGKCPDCGEWNSFEEIVSTGKKDEKVLSPEKLDSITNTQQPRYKSKFEELDRVLGGGLAKGSVALISGKPGAGKSTLLLQAMASYSEKHSALYTSGEESTSQIKDRVNRCCGKSDVLVTNENNIDAIITYAKTKRPDIIAIDSVQTMVSPDAGSIPGTMSQIRDGVAKIVATAKQEEISFFLVGHVTKDGKIAGPKLLEHMVDVVIEFEGEDEFSYRILRTSKNRFGAVNEIGVFNMTDKGIEEVSNPSQYFVEEQDQILPGSVIVPVLEGNRVFLVEVQALATNSVFGMPRRISQGLDLSKVQIICAIAEKSLALNLMSQDVFFNIPGGVKSKDTALSLGALAALVSSMKNIAIPRSVAFMGEIGLSGEVRKVAFADRRVKELSKLGFTEVVVPKSNLKELKDSSIKVTGIANISQLNNVFENL